MADVRTITLVERAPSLFRTTVRQGIAWGFLVGAAGLSRMWFGGAWIVDMMILVAMVLLVTGAALRESGNSVKMTPDELRRWVDAGMPNDVGRWRADHRN